MRIKQKAKQINREIPIPLYYQIKEKLKATMGGRDGEQLPSEYELVDIYGVSRITARQALTALVNDHLAYRVRGKGTFIGQRPIESSSPDIEKKYNTIGIMISTEDSSINKLQSPFHYTVLSGIENVAGQDYSLKIISRNIFDKKKSPNISKEALMVDGIIIICPRKKDRLIIESVQKNFCPYVVIYKIGEDAINNVQADSRGGALALTEYILNTGRKKIAFVGPVKSGGGVLMQFQGYREALKRHGIRWNSEMLSEEHNLSKALDQVLQDASIDAIMAANDSLAARIIEELRKRGKAVPEEILVAGFGNIGVVSPENLPLTVNIPLFDIGREAAKAVIGIINGTEHKTVQIDLETELIINMGT